MGKRTTAHIGHGGLAQATRGSARGRDGPRLHGRRARRLRPGSAAFSLVELLVVVAILTVLVSILIPSLGRAKELARRATCASNLRTMGTAHQTYATAVGKGKLVWAPPAHTNYGIWSFFSPAVGCYSTGLLVQEGYIDTGRALYCPSWRHVEYSYDGSHGWPADGDFTGKPWASHGYHYRATFHFGDEASGTQRYRVASMQDSGDEPIMCDGFTGVAFMTTVGVDQHHRDGYNVSTLGGDVKYHHDPDRVLGNWVAQLGLGVTSWDMFEPYVWDYFFRQGLAPTEGP